MFKAIHGIAPTNLSDRIVMNFYANGYDTRGSNMELYLPTLPKEAYQNSFMHMGGNLWNDLLWGTVSLSPSHTLSNDFQHANYEIVGLQILKESVFNACFI